METEVKGHSKCLGFVRWPCLCWLRDRLRASLEEEQEWETAHDAIDMEVDLEAPLGRHAHQLDHERLMHSPPCARRCLVYSGWARADLAGQSSTVSAGNSKVAQTAWFSRCAAGARKCEVGRDASEGRRMCDKAFGWTRCSSNRIPKVWGDIDSHHEKVTCMHVPSNRFWLGCSTSLTPFSSPSTRSAKASTRKRTRES